MTTLVTGGTGYIGAHVVDLLHRRGDSVVIVDDMATGIPSRVPGDVPLLKLDLSDGQAAERVRAFMLEHGVDEAIHFAARKQVGESVERPLWYYQQNVGGFLNLLDAVQAAGVERLVFSSSAAVYGNGQGRAIRESDPTLPVNPYGQTKLMGELMLRDITATTSLRAISLRYFNVAGAGRAELSDRAVLNLVPMVFERITTGRNPLIFGDSYDTPDGTCVRDFVHVVDLAEAHLAALASLRSGSLRYADYNVGTGHGYSVAEVVSAVAEISGRSFHPEVAPPRRGDPAAVVADVSKIETELDWVAKRSLTDMVSSAWQAWDSSS